MLNRMKFGVGLGIITVLAVSAFEPIFDFALNRDALAFLTLIAGSFGAALPNENPSVQ